MSWERNPYSNPENCGLRIVGELDRSSGSYNFDLFVVWQRTDDGSFVYGTDSGDSCPSPFEDYSYDGGLGLAALNPFNPADELDRLLRAWVNEYDYSSYPISANEREALVDRVREAIRTTHDESTLC